MKYMKRKPVIGLSGSRIRMEGGYLTGMEKSLVNSDYLDAVLRVGGLPVIIRRQRQLRRSMIISKCVMES